MGAQMGANMNASADAMRSEPAWREPPRGAYNMDAAAHGGIEPQFRSAPRSAPRSTVYGDDYSPQPEPGYSRGCSSLRRNSREVFYIAAAIAIVAAVVGSYWVMSRDSEQQTDPTRVSAGAVGDPATQPAKNDTDAMAEPTQPVQQVAVAPAAVKSVVVPPVTNVKSVTDTPAVPAVPQARPRAVTAQVAPLATTDDDARNVKSSMYPRADLARNLAIAHAGLDKDNLTLAHSAIGRVLSEQPRNADAQAMRQDLASREADRDSLLGFARLCARQQNWNCAWQNAGHALTIDSSSHEAHELLSQAIAERGTMPTPPQPDVPAVPQAQSFQPQ